MSRLDDQLRKAFGREQPSADFTYRVLERIALEPEPRPSWWRRLAMLIQPPTLRWVAIGVTASLLLAIGAAQYARLRQPAVTEPQEVAKTAPPTVESPAVVAPKPEPPSQAANAAAKVKRSAPSTNHRLVVAERQRQQEMRAEAEAAKEKLMLALHIASVALSDAQKAVHDDGPKP